MIIDNKELDRIYEIVMLLAMQGGIARTAVFRNPPTPSDDLNFSLWSHSEEQRALSIFGMPIVIDPFLSPGELHLIDGQGNILAAITNIGEG